MGNIKSDNTHKSKASFDFKKQKLQYFQSLEQFKNRVLSFNFNQLAAMHNMQQNIFLKYFYSKI